VRRVALASVLVFAALALPAQALAHATLRSTAPDFRQRFERAPREVILRFDQSVELPSITVVTARGEVVSRPTVSLADGRVVAAPLEPLARGAYTVRWHVTSADSHTVSGVFTFGVRADAPLPTEAYGASGPTRTEHVVRWAYFLALALLIGGLGSRLLVLRSLPVSPALEQRFALMTGIGVVAVLEVGIAAFLLRAEDALQLPFGDLLYGDLSPISGGTRFGHAFVAMTLGYALVAALLYLAWLLDRPVLLWPALVISLGFASGLSLSGHSAVDRGSSWLSQLADWVHLAAACLWIGGLVALVACIWPLAPELRRTAFLRFSQIATVLVGLLVTAGVYLSVLRLPQVSDLWTASYGRVLLVKLGLVSVALLWGAFHHFVVRPAISRPGFPLGRMSRSLAAESLVGVAILLVAAVLVDSKPPAPPTPNPTEAAHVAR
jgi:copper transport protein